MPHSIYNRILNSLSSTTSIPPTMRGHVAHCAFSLGCGGAERQLLATIRGLSKRGFTQHVICSSLSNNNEKHYQNEVHALGAVTIDASTQQLSCLLARSALRKLRFFPKKFATGVAKYVESIAAISPEIVHIWSGNMHALTAAILLNAPNVLISWQSISPQDRYALSRQTLLPMNIMRLAFHRMLYKIFISSSKVRCSNNSNAGARSFEKWIGLPKYTVETLYNGIDISVWDRQNPEYTNSMRAKYMLSPTSHTIIGAMRFETMKRPLLWIKTAHAVIKNRKDTTAILFGDGPLRPQLEAYINAHSLGNRILLPGIEKDMPTAMRMGDVFLLTSLYEGVPNVLLEAQASRVPVVTTNAGGAGEAIVNEITGWVCQDANITTLAERIQFCLDNTQWRERARCLAPGFIQERFGIDAMINTTLRLYGFAETASHTA